MQISDQIIQVFDDLCKRFGVAIDWSAQNILPYAEDLYGRLVQRGITISIARIALFASFLIGFPIIMLQIRKNWDEDENLLDHELFLVVLIIGVTCGLVCLGLLIANIFDLIDYLYCPELPILQFVRGLL